MIDRENDNIIPIERGYQKREEEISELQKKMEKAIEDAKKAIEEANREIEIARVSSDREREEDLQKRIFSLEHAIEEGEKLIAEGFWKRFELWEKENKAILKREDAKKEE